MNVSRETKLAKLSQYKKLVLKWNRIVPLVSRKRPEITVERLVDHASQASHCIPGQTANIFDIGSGSGIPGVPMAILQPQIAVSLIEPNNRKCDFLKAAKRELALDNLLVINDIYRREQLENTNDKLITSMGLKLYESIATDVWSAMQNGDNLMLFVKEEQTSKIAADVSCETFNWAKISGHDFSGIALFQF